MASSYPIEINGIYYLLNPDDRTAEVTPAYNGEYTGAIVIPQTISFDDKLWGCVKIGAAPFLNLL